MIEEVFFDDRDSLFAALLQDCQQRLREAVALRGQASLLVSGGSTPQPLYQALAASDLPWQAITVALVDERWVSPDQAGSNEAFVRQQLLQSNAAAAQYIPSKNQHDTARAGIGECETAYQSLPRPFDLTILGMGPDAHTASLFPHAEGLDEAMDLNRHQLCAAIKARQSAVTGDLCERMTLSLYGLLQSRQLHLLITGEEKRAVYRSARASDNWRDKPISAVLQQPEVPVLVYWAP